MTCRDHAEPAEGCVGCLGRWDRALAEDRLQFMHGMEAAALRMAIAEIDRLTAVVDVGDQLAGRLLAERDALTVARNSDRTEWMTTYATMHAELEALRCGDLDAFHDGELDDGRRAAFQLHLGACEACQAGLESRMQFAVRFDEPEPPR